MKFRLSIDRFEGDKKEIAVLLDDDGKSLNVPKRWLPKGAKAGDVLAVSFERDADATRQVADRTKQVQDQLKASDTGGDISL